MNIALRERSEAPTGEPVRRWLLQGPLHPLPPGEGHRRCGVLGQCGPRAYLYPEIAGYYLRWLAQQPDAPAEVAPSILRWLLDWASADRPPARVALEPVADWRAAALFAFDLAMLRRGCAHWPALEPVAELAGRIDALLGRLITADGQLAAVCADQPMPLRWSTRPGAYQAKVAIALLESDTRLPLPAPLAAATRQLANAAPRCPSHSEHHPELYAIEGLLVLDRRQARGRLCRLLERVDADGWLREGAGGGRRRTDVQAQAVRAARRLGLADSRITRMTRALAAAIRPDGSLPFDPDEHHAPANTWCALFAAEALAASHDTAGMPT